MRLKLSLTIEVMLEARSMLTCLIQNKCSIISENGVLLISKEKSVSAILGMFKGSLWMNVFWKCVLVAWLASYLVFV